MTLKKIREKYIKTMFNLVMLLMIMIFLLLNIIRVNDNVKTQGEIISKNITYIKSPCETYLKEVFVVLGEEVKQGQLLARLDTNGVRTYIQQLKEEIIAAQNRKNLISKEFITVPYQITSFEQEVTQIKTRLNLSETTYRGNERLYKDGVISILDFKRSETEYLNLRSELAKADNNLKIYRAQNDDNQFRNKAELSLIDSKIDRLTKQLTELEQEFSYTDSNLEPPCIIAPSDGVITAIGEDETKSSEAEDGHDSNQSDRLIGKKFTTNDTIFEISDPRQIYIASNIREIDFPFVFEGDKAKIIIPAYPYADYGVLTGILTKLHKEPTLVSGNKVYRCEISIMNIDSNKDIKAYLGLSTLNTVDAKTNYCLLEYMFLKIFERPR